MAPAITISEDQETIDAILAEVADAKQEDTDTEEGEMDLPDTFSTSEADLQLGLRCEAVDFYPNKEGEWTQKYPYHIEEAAVSDEIQGADGTSFNEPFIRDSAFRK